MAARNNKPGRIVKSTSVVPTLKKASGIWTLDEAMQAHRENRWPQPDLYQPIANSLRNSVGKTAYISREAPARSGSQRKFTFSWWLKRNSLNSGDTVLSQQHLFYSYDGSRLFQIFFERGIGTNPDCIVVYGGGTDVRFIPVLRDSSAWYHIVIAFDIDQTTDSNRIKCWLNGVQVTNFGTQGGSPGTPSWPTSATNWPVNQAGVYQRIGGNSAGGSMDGQFAEINLVDGQQLPATLFGKYDSNDTWVPVEYTGSHGTNGFYLPFNNATTSQTLGYDAGNIGSTYYEDYQDPYRGHVSLHLTGNGPAGRNNSVFGDSSPNAFPITSNVSTPIQGSFSPFDFDASVPYNSGVHGGSIYQDGPYLTAPNAAASSLGTGDFTIEGWYYGVSFGTDSLFRRLWAFGSGLSEDVSLNVNTSGNIVYRNNDAILITSSIALSLNTWNHVAVVRSGGTTTIYINGLSVGTTTTNNDLTNAGASIFGIGAYPATGTGRWLGYISSFRIVKGDAVYIRNFTPPRKPFGARTNNLIRYNTEDFVNWTGGDGLTITPSAEIAPDQTPTASLCVPSTSNISQNVAGIFNSPAGVNTFSIYAKSAGYRYVQVLLSRTADNDVGYVTYDLQTESVHNSSVWTGSIENVGNGWYRLIANTSSFPSIANNSNVRWLVTDGTNSRGPSFTGDGTSGVYLWGAQAESGATVTEYTPVPENHRTAPSLLLNFANAAIVDSSGSINALTNNSASITNASKYGTGALTFSSGTSDYLSIPSSNQFYFGVDDFTIESWWRSDGSQATYATIISQDFTGSPNTGAWKFANRSTGPQFTYGTGSGGLTNLTAPSSVNINDGNWHHYAVTRSKSTLRMFVDGQIVALGSIPATQVVGQNSTITYVGYNPRDNAYLYGSVDDLRITKGVARYTTDFTPPTRALPETGGKSFVTQNVNAGVVRTFTTTGTTSWTAPSDVSQVEVLVVAGGGGGGFNGGGGGGAGGLIYNNQYSVTPGQTYTVTVGAGGAGSSFSVNQASNGGNSIFGNLTAIGGSGGNSRSFSGTMAAGGSGGGGSGATSSASAAAGDGTAGQGFNGGAGTAPDLGASAAGGGGGGGGATGSAGASQVGGGGGAGLLFGITGTPYYFAGGGGGGLTVNGAGGAGGLGGGGGGAGSTSGGAGGSGINAGSAGGTGTSTPGGNGGANTGGGGGGGDGSGTGGTGGSGIVIVRYTTTAVGNTSDSTTDNLVDSPTLYGHDYGNGGEVVGNYCTLNPIDTETNHSFSNGNLTLFKSASNWSSVRSTMAFSSGKWYFETTYNASWDYAHVGVLDVTVDTYPGQVANTGYVGYYAKGWAYQQDARIWNNNTLLTGSGAVRSYAGDISMCAVDMDNGKIWWGRNGTWFNNGNPATDTNAAYSDLSGTVSPAFSVYGNSSGITVNFGQRPWAYAPPEGFNALTTKNLTRPTGVEANPQEYFKSVAYTAAGTVQAIDAGFTPDLVWIKGRDGLFTPNAMSHGVYDTIRGGGFSLSSEAQSVQYDYSGHPNGDLAMDFTATGFTTPPVVNNNINYSGANYVAWMWKAGGTAVSNSDGTITSQVSASPDSGFSIVKFNTGVNPTDYNWGHGLTRAPEFIIAKGGYDSNTYNWDVYHKDVGPLSRLKLNSADAAENLTGPVPWGDQDPSDTVVYQSNFYNNTNSAWYGDNKNCIAYCWHSVPGYSSIGSYTGNGSADGPFVYTGFRPAFLIAKRYDIGSNENWFIVDSARNTFNPADNWLSPSLVNDEGDTVMADLLSNGFKLRSTAINASGGAYIYIAFAEKPFGNVNGTAR